MIISYTNKFVFFKTPKVGGTSIQNALKEVCEVPDYVMYGNIEQLTDCTSTCFTEFMAVNEVYVPGFFTFGFTRNPWDLVVSRYLYEFKRGRLPDFYMPDRTYFNLWIQHRYVMQNRYVTDRTSTWLFKDDKQVVMFIGKFENLQEDFDYVCRVIGCGKLKLEHYNKAQISVNYKDWYTDYSKQLISKAFEFEIDYFKYSF